MDGSLHKQAQRLRIYIGESDHWRGKSLYVSLLETLKINGIAGATVLRGVAGYGARSQIHTAAILRLSEDLPLVIDVVDTPEKISQVLEVIYPMVPEGLITLEDIRVVKYTHRYLNPLPADKAVEEAMTRAVVTLSADMPVSAAWQTMLKSQVKALPVINTLGEVVGMLTSEDLLERAGLQQRLAVAARMDPAVLEEELKALRTSPLKVEDVMSKPVETLHARESLGAAAARMAKTGMKRFPVVDELNRLVGILSRLDVLQQVANSPRAVPPVPLPAEGITTVKDVMTGQVPVVAEDSDLAGLVEAFNSHNSHRLIVVDAAGKAVGLVSDSDVVGRLQPSQQRGVLDALRQIGKPPASKARAFDLMSPGPLTAAPDLPVVEAARLMLAGSRKWLVVVDEAGKPLGLVDRQILLQALVAYYQG